MKKMAAGVFKANCLAVMDDVQAKHETIVITKRGKPVAKLVPTNGGVDRSQAQAALQRMRDRAVQAGLGAFDWETLKADRDASRP